MRQNIKLIIDGDFGGDEMQLMAVALGNEEFSVLGITSVFGNTTGENVVRNALALKTLFRDRAFHLPVYRGHDRPLNNHLLEGDGAHGKNGMGNADISSDDFDIKEQHAVDFIIETLLKNPKGTVTITATGPQTNIAAAIRKNPDAMRRVKQIVIMGGATEEMWSASGGWRKGNITEKAEFNFYQDAEAADIVLKSGLPIFLMPMNCTHGLTFTPAYEEEIRAELSFDPDVAEKIVSLMEAPRELDWNKFNMHPVMHDVNTTLFLMYPHAYVAEKFAVQVVPEGECVQVEDGREPITVVRQIIDVRLLHNEVKESLTETLWQMSP